MRLGDTYGLAFKPLSDPTGRIETQRLYFVNSRSWVRFPLLAPLGPQSLSGSDQQRSEPLFSA